MSSYKPIENVLDFNVALKPSTAFPLDARTMFGSFEEAMAAAATAEDAGSDNTVYYFGQTVTVYEDGISKSYLIQPDGNGVGTLVELNVSVPVEASSAADLEPDTYRVYGEVDTLTVNLVPKDDGLVHEYCFEFIPTEAFTELNVTPEVQWANILRFEPGRVHQASIVRGVGVLVYA